MYQTSTRVPDPHGMTISKWFVIIAGLGTIEHTVLPWATGLVTMKAAVIRNSQCLPHPFENTSDYIGVQAD